MSFPEDPLPGLRPPRPPAALRRRVLEAARDSSAGEGDSWIDRLWHSGTARRLWLAATVLLASLHLVSVPSGRSRPGVRRPTTAFAPTSLAPRIGPPLGGIEEQIRLAETILSADPARWGS